MPNPIRYIEVALDVPLAKSFTYAVPNPAWRLQVGALVQVPWRQKTMSGIILQVHEKIPPVSYKIRNIASVVQDYPIISKPLLDMLCFMASYYAEPVGACIALALPKGMMRDGVCVYRCAPEANVELLDSENERAKFALAISTLGTQELTGAQLCKDSPITYFDLDSWRERGLLHARWTLLQERRQESRALFVEAIPEAIAGKKLGAKQSAILETLKSQGRTTLSALNITYANCGHIVRRLQELGLVHLQEDVQHRSSFDDCIVEHHPVTLTDEQSLAIAKIESTPGFCGFLLHGVTGSGKTEVYLRIMKNVREQGKGALMVLPEIALTPQFCAIFRAVFGDDVAVLHSGLSEAERFDAWSRLQSGQVHIALGARSALFAPVQNIGLIVIDEEHDGSFKQAESPRYHARDMALVLGQRANCPVILGSATPSLESFSKAQSAKLCYLTLHQRPQARPMPSIQIIDMAKEHRAPLDPALPPETLAYEELKQKLLSPALLNAITQTLQRKEQIIIFLNRRGHSTFIQCSYCGYAAYCPHCAVSMTYHQYAKALRCHYCGYEQALPTRCPKCNRTDIGLLGYGTERLVTILQQIYPSARIERLDRDRAGTKELRHILQDFKTGQTDILVGTQMLAKGHDIHNVTLVGVISADLSLNLPDFRASERTFQLLTQVSGRAGRGSRPGQVLIQSLVPDHPVLQAVCSANYTQFAFDELRLRQALAYPPFVFLILIRIQDPDISSVERLARGIALCARRTLPTDGVVLGPAPAPIIMLRGNNRYQIMLKHPKRPVLHPWLRQILYESQNLRKAMSTIKIIIDIDPLDMM